MTAVGLGQHGFEATGPGSILSRAKYFHNCTDIFQEFHSIGSPGTGGRTTGF